MKKFLLAAVSAVFLATCSTPDSSTENARLDTSNESSMGNFNISIDIPEAGNSAVRISLENNQILFEGALEGGRLDANLDDILPQHVMVQIEQLGAPGMYFHEGTDVSIAFDSNVGYDITAGALQDSVKVFNQRFEIFNNTMGLLEIKFSDAVTLGDISAQEQIQAEAINLMDSQFAYSKEFAKRNDLLGTAIILSQDSPELTLEDYQEVLNNVSPQYHACPDYIKLQEKISQLARTSIGETFKDFTQSTPEGESMSILSIEGSYVLIDFWASWCRPCRDANPELVKSYNTYHDKGFNIVGISLDQNVDDWKRAIAEDKLVWPQLIDRQNQINEVAAYYVIEYIPQNILIDDNGIIVGKNLRPEELDNFLTNNL
jgi:thiol-disulfide isomerase/thioredoxin